MTKIVTGTGAGTVNAAVPPTRTLDEVIEALTAIRECFGGKVPVYVDQPDNPVQPRLGIGAIDLRPHRSARFDVPAVPTHVLLMGA